MRAFWKRSLVLTSLLALTALWARNVGEPGRSSDVRAKKAVLRPDEPAKPVLICIDPGHGGKDPGNERSVSKYKHEKDLNLQIAQLLGGYLQERVEGVKVIYTRTDDTFVSLEDRAEFANSRDVDYFISIHCNSSPVRAVRGSRVHIHSHKFEASEKLAQRIEKELRTRAARHSRGIMDARQRGYNLYVLQYTKMPGVLLELGFMSNYAEERYLNSNYGQDILASAIFRSVRDYVQEHHGEFKPAKRNVIYRVQISASEKPVPLNHPTFKKLGLKVEEYKEKNDNTGYSYKYVVGREYERKLALKLVGEVKKKGFKDAFIIKIREEES